MNIEGFYINIKIFMKYFEILKYLCFEIFMFLFHEINIKLKAWFEVTEFDL